MNLFTFNDITATSALPVKAPAEEHRRHDRGRGHDEELLLVALYIHLYMYVLSRLIIGSGSVMRGWGLESRGLQAPHSRITDPLRNFRRLGVQDLERIG